MKKLLSTLIIFALVFTLILPVYTYASSDINVTVNGKLVKFDQQPIIDQNNRTLVPIRFISEELGATVDWDNATQQVTIIKEEKVIELTVGKTTAKINSTTYQLDTKPIILNGRTLVPVRFISEALGTEVEWDNATQTVIITQDGYVAGVPVIELPEIDESIFEKENIAEISSYGKYVYKDGRLLFNEDYSGLENYELSTDVNPYINEQIKGAFTSLLSENHYVELRYNSNSNLALLGVTWGEKYAQNSYYMFSFIFREEAFNNKENWSYKNKDFSENVVISLELGQLWKDPSETEWATPFYKDILKDTFIALFGEKDGIDIYNYVLGEYLSKKALGNEAYKGKLESKQFGNIQVDFSNDYYSPNSLLYFDFSYIR